MLPHHHQDNPTVHARPRGGRDGASLASSPLARTQEAPRFSPVMVFEYDEEDDFTLVEAPTFLPTSLS